MTVALDRRTAEVFMTLSYLVLLFAPTRFLIMMFID